MSRKRDLQRLNDYHICTASLGNKGSILHRQSTEGCIRLELSNIFSFIATFFSEQCGYSKGEHISYSASTLEINDMQGLKQGIKAG
jgi:hypothetical protein